MVMATPGVTGTLKHGMTKSQITTEMASIVSNNTTALETGKSIIGSRSSGSVAGAAQALANQTGGNILGFTYE